MSEPESDFLRDYQAFAQQSWEAWTRQFQPQDGVANPFVAPPRDRAESGEAPLQPIIDGLAAYAEWLKKGLDSVAGENAGNDWRSQFERWFSLPSSSASAPNQAQDPAAWWRVWSAGANAPDTAGPAAMPPWFPSLGYGRDRHVRHQQLMQASLDCVEASKPYQELLLRVHTEGVALLRERLASGELVLAKDDIHGLYKAWVDATEQAYSKISMTSEFRGAYAKMVNAQMQLHKMQRQQIEETCREFGMPTRSEFDELAQRIHELRRAWRAGTAAEDPPTASRRPANAGERSGSTRSHGSSSANSEAGASRQRRSQQAPASETASGSKGAVADASAATRKPAAGRIKPGQVEPAASTAPARRTAAKSSLGPSKPSERRAASQIGMGVSSKDSQRATKASPTPTAAPKRAGLAKSKSPRRR